MIFEWRKPIGPFPRVIVRSETFPILEVSSSFSKFLCFRLSRPALLLSLFLLTMENVVFFRLNVSRANFLFHSSTSSLFFFSFSRTRRNS